jgi:hypothetical protein
MKQDDYGFLKNNVPTCTSVARSNEGYHHKVAGDLEAGQGQAKDRGWRERVWR